VEHDHVLEVGQELESLGLLHQAAGLLLYSKSIFSDIHVSNLDTNTLLINVKNDT
jgi:hypothetical protein